MKITLIDSLHPAFVEALEKNGGFEINDRSEISSDAVVSVLADTEILVVRSKVQVTAALLDAAPKLNLFTIL
jgi:phosphoglycerate dehydrogenase-like enzyme